MSPRLLRPRLVATGFALSGMLAFALLGVISSSASTKAGGKVFASLTKTSFPAAQAKTVKLVYKFSPASKRFAYLLSQKKGAKWVKVRGVDKKGRFKGAYKMTVKTLFGSKTVKVGQYRVKISADANSVTRSFKVVKPPSDGGSDGGVVSRLAPGVFNKTSPAGGATGQPTTAVLNWGSSSDAGTYEYCIDTTDNNVCDYSWVTTGSATSASVSGLAFGRTYYWQVRANNAQGTTVADGAWFSFVVAPLRTGYWSGPGLDPDVEFYVSLDQTQIREFTLSWSAGSCTAGPLSEQIMVGNLFSRTTTTFSFSGTLDSSTTAHGTASATDGPGCGDTGTVAWTATWVDDTQP